MPSTQNLAILYKFFPNLKFLFAPSDEPKDHNYWREQIVDAAFAIFAYLGLLAYIPSVYMAVHSEYWTIVLVDSIAYISIIAAYLGRKHLPFFFKVCFLICTVYFIGVSILLVIDADYSMAWIFSGPVLAAILLGLRAALFFLMFNLSLLVITGYLIVHDLVEWSEYISDPLNGWFIFSVNFMFLNVITAIAISILVEQLKNSLDKVISANRILDNERKKLIYEIQQRIKAEEEKDLINAKLQQSQKMEAIGMMAGGVAHDLNNILSGIIHYPDMLLRKLPGDSELRRPLSTIMKAGNRAADIVADLLTVARGVASIKQPHNLNAIVNEYMDSSEAVKLKSLYPDVVISTKLDETLPNIYCSHIHIFKSLLNLVANSAEAINEDGNITISTSIEEIPADTDNPEQTRADCVVLEVNDNGKGISKNDIQHIFEPFYTRKAMGLSGTGLGLTIVWNTVQDHGGSISVTSDNAAGTCFRLSFPVCEQQLPEPLPSFSEEELFGDGQSILVVDDEATQREIAMDILHSLNYRVAAVDSGNAAIEYLKSSSVDLILLDMIMPPGMNGVDTYKEVVKINPHQKTMFVSGFVQYRDIMGALNTGAVEFLAKPYSRTDFALAVKSVLGQRATA